MNSLQTAEIIRVLPKNIEAEQSVLGAIMINNETYEVVSEYLQDIHFSVPVNGQIYNAIGKILAKGLSADPITLRAFFEKNNDLSSIGGGEYLVSLVSAVFSVLRAEDYAHIIVDMYIRRRLLLLGEEISLQANAFDLEKPAMKQIEEAEEKLYKLSDVENKGDFADFDKVLSKTMHELNAAYNSDGALTGITTGFIDLDKHLGGLNKSDLIILAGRPSMGKTALATNIAFNAAFSSFSQKQGGGKVAFFSLEMSYSQLATRILSQVCNIQSERLRRGEIKEEDYNKVAQSAQQLKDVPLFIDETPALSVATIRTRARRLKRKHGLDLIIIDYLQLIQGSEKRSDNRVQEISDITRALKALAKELNIPIIALSQLSRAVETRDDKRPQLADLRESGSIEQDADIVMFVYRDEYYEARHEPPPGTDKHIQWLEKMEKIYNLADIIIAKQRHGPIGTVKLFFDGKYTKFDNLSDSRKSCYE